MFQIAEVIDLQQFGLYSSTKTLLRVRTSHLTWNSSTKLKMQVLLYAIKLHVISSLAACLGRRPEGQQNSDTGVFVWLYPLLVTH